MPRLRLRVLRTTGEMLTEIERTNGAALPSDVLELCKLYRAAESTIRAQREVIETHARTIGELRKGRT